ncbi:molecular chaperone [Christiangramia sp. SM2212]|uniref:Molecular chaperone n=1 Tax=Christiangramia sediminicola TaxID=3073267 RepID=A0ABU1EP97_9FLAO|nr:molecular chaperone [Christiangramia sp. SM2212]MDR5590215.1 molecular chaperone [Christiangramia sp. SM2212]
MKNRITAVIGLFILLFPLSILAQGDLMIMPKRIIFEGNERSQEINLINTGKDTATFAISFIQYLMDENGEFTQVSEPAEGQKFADPFLRFFPRRVTLPPQQAQTVRLQVTRTGEMSDGEYRSHAYFRAIEKQTALKSETEEESQDNISINIKTVFGISIPVIIRRGETEAGIQLSDISFNKEANTISLVLNRSGNISTYGNLKVELRRSGDELKEVGLIKGIAVYTPNSKRNFSFELQNKDKVDISGGDLIISYETSKGKVYDEQVISVD